VSRIHRAEVGSKASCVTPEPDGRFYLLREAVLVRPAGATMRARCSSGRTHRDRVTMRARRSRPGKSRVRRRGSASREILRRRHRRTVPCPGGLPAARRGAPQGRFGPGRDDRWRAFSEASIRLTGETRSGTNRNAESAAVQSGLEPISVRWNQISPRDAARSPGLLGSTWTKTGLDRFRFGWTHSDVQGAGWHGPTRFRLSGLSEKGSRVRARLVPHVTVAARRTEES
jgi:hypothetical protein